MAKAGDVVVVDFPGVQGIKRRPTVIVSSALYNKSRPDVIVGVLTSQTGFTLQQTDYLLQDWQAVGLKKPSVFRSFLVTLPKSAILATIGKLSDRDRQAVAACIHAAMLT